MSWRATSEPFGSSAEHIDLADGFCLFFFLWHWCDLKADPLIARIRLVVIVLVFPNVLRDAFREGATCVLVRAVAVKVLAGGAHRLNIL